MARDAALTGLDTAVDGIATDAATSAELFAVVDVLDGQPRLRRSLSDPSATDESRAGLAKRLFGGKVSEAAVAVLGAVVQKPWGSGSDLVGGLERQGIRLALQQAQRDGSLARVIQELYTVLTTVDGNPELQGTLRNKALPVDGKQTLVSKLINGKVAPATETLASRAVKARQRNFTTTVASYLQMAADLTGEKIARVKVARPLDDARVSRLKAALETQVGAPVSLQIEVDPSVLGGMSVAIDDDVIESTVAGRLEQARRQLINL
ncbi:MAG TPA: F0F1 ATP synthase subunit delta [Tessaracoccus flavescens]|uniref:ATP synthase subunit delta n=1 Tax=Tessaracoccus flavescens TaxID=399497 RepID=A0A921EQY5_9ACTN|nr:F0F1 ATP synthase subunit delta [Tessaracoccus flavescens]